jgi:hypothetical protein
MTLKKKSHQLIVEQNEYILKIPLFNTKVHAPLLNVGAAMDCPNKEICPFSKTNYKKTKYPWCYAQKIENLRPDVLKARRKNEEFISNNNFYETGSNVANLILPYLKNYIRVNEGSDLAYWNINFLIGFCETLKSNKITPFTYSKSLEMYINKLNKFCNIMISEKDFICVDKDFKETENLCPGVGCGVTCLRCVNLQKTYVIRH